MSRKRTAAELLAWPSQSESDGGFALLGVTTAAGDRSRHPPPATIEELQERLRAKFDALVKSAEEDDKERSKERKVTMADLAAKVESDTKEMKAMLARVSAIEKQLAAEAEEDAAAMERAEAKQKDALAALDEGYAAKVAAIRASMARVKAMAKHYCA